MTQRPPTEPSGPESRSRFSDLHTRTFEMELLISGALLFVLLKVPSRLDAVFFTVVTRTAGELRMVPLYGLVYVQLMVYALILFLILHLATRAFWIGLVGLESVYPDGPQWSKLPFGPFAIRHYRTLTPSLPRLIERLDDVCSLIFSFAFLLVLIFAYSVVVAVSCALAAIVVSKLSGGALGASWVFWALLLLVVFPHSLVIWLDRRIGPRLAEAETPSRRARALAAAVRWTAALTPTWLIASIQTTLQSNVPKRRMQALTVGSIFALTALTIVSSFVRAGEVELHSFLYFPEPATGVDARWYRSTRPADADRYLPSIQSDVVTEPYVVLVVPYFPKRYNPVIEERCPDLAPLSAGGLLLEPGPPPTLAAQRATLDCFRSLFGVALDGRPLARLRFDFYRDETDTRGVAAYLPVAQLSPGRHELRVELPGGEPQSRVVHVIPFWI